MTRIIYIVGIITIAVMILAASGMLIEIMKNRADVQEKDLSED